MKTLLISVFILIFVMQYQNSFSYGIAIMNPCVTREFPTPIFHPVSSISVDFRLDTFHITDSRFARCKIYVIQGNNQLLMYDETVEAGMNLSTPINPANLNGFGYNEPLEIKIVATSALFPNIPYTCSAFAIIYKAGMSRKYGSLFSGTPSLINEGPATFYSTNDCRTLASGIYFIKQYLLTFTLTGNFNDSIPEVDGIYSLGYSGSLPNYQQRWAFKISQTTSEAKFITFIYKAYNVLGQEFVYFPADLQKANVVYHYVSRPIITSLTQYPNPITPGNNAGLIKCNVQTGTEPISYEWRDSNNIHNHRIINFGDNCPFIMIIGNFNNYNSLLENFSVSGRAYNQYGYSEWKKWKVRFDDEPHGCPFIATEIEGQIIKDNPVFNKSPDDPLRDITDNYMLNDPLLEKKDSVAFTITENSEDETRIDKVELLRVSAGKDKEVCVTEEGEVIDYTTCQLKNTALLNYKEDVTELLRLNDNELLEFKKNDKLDFNFIPDKKEGYIVMRIRTAGNKTKDAALINTSNGQIINVKCRSGMSKVAIRVKPEGFTGFTMTALEDSWIDQIDVVSNDNEHLTEKLNITDAYNISGSILKHVADADNVYAYISKGNPGKFIFKNTVDTENRSFYFVKLSGGYKSASAENEAEKSDPEINHVLDLSDNIPNPFNPVTKIKYEIPEAGIVKLAVFDISGREIRSLVNEYKPAGKYEAVFDAVNGRGRSLASGVYFYRLQTKGQILTKRMILIK